MTERPRYDASQGPRIIRSRDGRAVDLDGVGVRFLVWGEDSGGGFSLVEHPIRPRHLAAPCHRHTREDGYSYVLEGRLGAQLGDEVVYALGDEVVYAEAGDLAFKPPVRAARAGVPDQPVTRIDPTAAPANHQPEMDTATEVLRNPACLCLSWRSFSSG